MAMSEAGKDAPSTAGTGYRVLARKYRPRDFSELIGQEPMVRTLTNAFAAGRIAQAWMLTGVRGVGKTTTARILARSLNYRKDGVDRPTVDPDGFGEHCQAILEGRHMDVIEMDAASHTGIDDIREIIEQVRYAPVSARYKVYIIDEVHMLSTQAFNGLLKTLEEPPPHVKFIFATTEIRKVPITILSRCQRFDLRRIDAGLIMSDLKRIAGLEGVTVEEEALAAIARAAEGSMRDAQSIFDQAIAHGSGHVTAEAVRDMLGLADRTRVITLFENLMKGDVAAALGELRSQYDGGADPVAILGDLATFTHLVTRLRFVPEAVSDPALSQEERQRGAEFASSLSMPVLSRTWQMLGKGIAEVQTSARPVSAAEMVLIRIAHSADLPTLDEALKTLRDGAPAAGQGSPTAPRGGNGGAPQGAATQTDAVARSMQPVRNGGGQTMRLVEQSPMPDEAPASRTMPVEEPPAIRIASLADIVSLADANRDMAFKVMLKRCVRPVRIEAGVVEIALTPDAPRSLMGDMTQRLQKWTGRRWVVSLSREQGGPTLAEQETERRDNAILDARNDPTVAAILAKFPGAKIIDVRIPDAVADLGDDPAPPAADPGIDIEDDDDDAL
jgi:DNA polymerase III subunit gamma/tau